MQLSLVAVFIPIVNILWCVASPMDWDCHLKNILQKCGFESSCVYNSLKTCYNSTTTPNESSLTDDIVSQLKSNTNTFTVLETLLQEAKSERENITTTLTEVKREQENITNVLTEVKREQENITNILTEVKTLLQEMKSERENSVSEIKTLLQEVKTEQQNEKRKSDKFEAIINSKIKNCGYLRVVLGDEFSGGVQTVYPYGFPNPKSTTVYCDQATDGGGWTVIQSRSPLPIRENFQRNWTEYVEGFGDPKGEFWVGLDNIHALTNSAKMLLRIDLEDADGKKAWALYSTFHVGDAASKYVLTIGEYSGDAGDGMVSNYENWNLNGAKFSTKDNDISDVNCAKYYKGGWWFTKYCSAVRLNGLPIVGEDPKTEGIIWVPFSGWKHSLKKATMKLRPVSLGF